VVGPGEVTGGRGRGSASIWRLAGDVVRPGEVTGGAWERVCFDMEATQERWVDQVRP
jgi:hypothetical protein